MEQQPTQTPMQPTQPNEPIQNTETGVEKKSAGPVIGIIIILLILIIGGIYIYRTTVKNSPANNMMMGDNTNQMMADPDSMPSTGTSDATQDISNDLNATDLNGLDAEIQNL